MKNKLTKNWGLKLGSFIVAVAIWVIVTNINDPIVTLRVNDVPVTFRNANLITDSGQIYEVLDGTDVIDTVTISAARTIIDSLDKSNVVAIADMNELTSLDTIAIRLSTNKYNDKLESIKGNIESVRLNIEEKKTKSLPIRANAVGEVREGYMVGDISTDQNLIKISGPESVISQITKAAVEIDVSGFTSNIGTDSTIRFYNEDGKEVVSNSIEKNITKVRVSVDILEMKTVPVNYVVTGVPGEGYLLNGHIESTKDSVVIAGKSALVNNISAIEVPEGVIDVTDTHDSVTVSVDLRKYLPDGIVLAESDFNGKAAVTVYVEQAKQREFTVPVEDIRIENIPEGYEAEITEPEDACSIVLTGLNEELQAVGTESVTASIDLAAWMAEQGMEEISAGSYQIALNIPMPNENVLLERNVLVRVHIMEKED